MNEFDPAHVAQFLNLARLHFCLHSTSVRRADSPCETFDASRPLRSQRQLSDDVGHCAGAAMTNLLCNRLTRGAPDSASSDEVADWFECVIADIDFAALAASH